MYKHLLCTLCKAFGRLSRWLLETHLIGGPAVPLKAGAIARAGQTPVTSNGLDYQNTKFGNSMLFFCGNIVLAVIPPMMDS
jgi:hypothetical protein